MSEIRQKVMAALTYLQNGNELPSVSKICRLAEISRANLYTTYPDLVELIKDKNKGGIGRKKSQTKIQECANTAEVSRLRSENKLLAYACVELRHALDREQEKTAFLKAKLKKMANSV